MWITRASINRPVLAVMMMLGLCVLGLFSYTRLGVERLPEVAPPIVTVAVAYPGASPEAVEIAVTRVVERAVNGVGGVKQVRSVSRQGHSQTTVEFNLDADMDRAVQEVRDKIAVLPPELPRDAELPTVMRMGWENDLPVMFLALRAPDRSARERSLLAEQTVLRRLERTDGVAQVEMAGLAVRIVRIDLDIARLRTHQLTPDDLITALQRANMDASVGLLRGSQADSIVLIEGRMRDAREFADVVVSRRGGSAIRLADVAAIVERERESTSIARVDGVPSVNFNIYKRQDANIVETGENLKQAVAELRKVLPPGVELKIIYADSDWTEESLDSVKRTLIEGALLTVLIVFLFLRSWRSTVITALTLPVSVIASFIAVHAFGYTLNFMTLMALSLCIGLLIDDAIIVRENITRHVHQGASHRQAAYTGTREIGPSVVATTLCVCAVFVPIAFTDGIIGMFFESFGVTVVAAVLVSLFVSFTLDPMLSSVWADPPSDAVARLPVLGHLMRATDRMMVALDAVYRRVLLWVFSDRVYSLWLPAPRWGLLLRQRRLAGLRPRRMTLTPRGIVLWAAFASLVGAVALTPLVGTEFIPESDNSFINLKTTLPVDTSLERADAKVAQIEAAVRALPEVRLVSTMIGASRPGEGGNFATLDIQLAPRAERSRTQKEIEAAIRERLARIPGQQMSIGSRDISVALMGPDPLVLNEQTERVAQLVRAIPGVTDLETSVKVGLPAYAVRMKPQAMRELGLTATDLSDRLRSYVNGIVPTYWTAPDGEQVEVELRLPAEGRTSIAQMAGLPVAYSANGTAIPLGSVADIVSVTNPEAISRQDLQRRQLIYAGVQGRAAGDVGADVKKLIAGVTLPPGYRFDVGGSTRDQDEALEGVAWALALSVISVYIVLASQFGSFAQPLAIMAALPLSLVGVMLALLVTNSTLNLFSMIGLIMLMGLVTKNAILLVDFANVARMQGAGMLEALLQAGEVRMRPIVMTTAAMVFGMLPLALALDASGELQASMGRAIIGGILTSSVLTLVVVPVLYSYVARSVRRAPLDVEETSAPGAVTPGRQEPAGALPRA